MNFERRGFLRATTAGLAGTIFNLEHAFSQEVQPQAKAPANKPSHQTGSRRPIEFVGGTGSLRLDLKLKSGTLEVDADNYSRGFDAGAFATGTFTPSGGSPARIYRSYFCVNSAKQVFCRLGDDDHWTSLVFAATDDRDIYSLALWQDDGSPEIFRLSKKAFLEAASETAGRPDPTKYILDQRGPAFKPDGNRKPPNITMEELIDALDDDRQFLAFVRGKNLAHQHAIHAVFPCFFYAKTFDAILAIEWEGVEF